MWVWSQSAPVFSQGFQQRRAEHDVAILAAFSALDVDDHSPAVNIGDLQSSQLRAPIEYEEYLKRIAELAKRVEAGQAEDTPKALDTPGKRALYNNLDQNEEVALKIDETVTKTRPDGWRGVQARELVIKRALYDVLQSEAEVERIFLIVKAQREY